MKILRVNFNLLWLSRFAREPLCILCGRPVTHRSPNVDPTWPVTWPDRQSAPVNRTGFHLWNKWLNFGGDPDHHLDTGLFPDSSLLGDMESGIIRLCCTSRHRHSNYDVITSPPRDRQRDWYRDTGKTCLGGGMHYPSASTVIDRVKWRHISMVAIRSIFCRSRPSYCA